MTGSWPATTSATSSHCGKGKHDRASADPVDKVRGCEKVKRKRRGR